MGEDSDNELNKKKFTQSKKVKLKKRSRSIIETSTTVIGSKDDTNIINTVMGSKKKKRKGVYNPEEESRLERLVFGDPKDIIQNLKSDSDSENTELKSQTSVISKQISNKIHDSNKVNDDNDDDAESVKLMKSETGSIITVDSTFTKEPAWKDEYDDELLIYNVLTDQHRKLPNGRLEKNYKELLQNKYQHIVGTPKWAKLNKSKDEFDDNSDDEILKHSNHLVQNKKKALPKDNIDLKVLSHINKQTHLEGPFVNTVQFHQQSTVALVAGSSGVLSLFEIDGRENSKLHSVQFERFPIHCARFLKEGSEVLVGSMSHAHCYSFDLLSEKTQRIPLPHGITNMKKFELSPDGKLVATCGRLGEIHLLSSTTKEAIGMIKMNKKCRSMVFTSDSSKLISHGESSEVYVWDLRSKMCINRAFDDGCLSGCSVALSPNGQFLATGSKQGAVNVYETSTILTERNPKPAKTVLNLVTAVTKLKFNPTSEILAIASDRKANSFKMLHLPSFHVFANFPTFDTTMFNPLDIDFSPGSGYMSVSNNKGFAYLYRLKHYGNY